MAAFVSDSCATRKSAISVCSSSLMSSAGRCEFERPVVALRGFVGERAQRGDEPEIGQHGRPHVFDNAALQRNALIEIGERAFEFLGDAGSLSFSLRLAHATSILLAVRIAPSSSCSSRASWVFSFSLTACKCQASASSCRVRSIDELVELFLLRDQLTLHARLLVDLDAEIAKQQNEQHDIQRAQTRRRITSRCADRRGSRRARAARGVLRSAQQDERAVEDVASAGGLASVAACGRSSGPAPRVQRGSARADSRVDQRADLREARERGVVRFAPTVERISRCSLCADAAALRRIVRGGVAASSEESRFVGGQAR